MNCNHTTRATNWHAVRQAFFVLCAVGIGLSHGDFGFASCGSFLQEEADLLEEDTNPDQRVPERLESLPEPIAQPLNGPAPGFPPSQSPGHDPRWQAGPQQFVIPPFGRSPDIQLDVEDGRISLVARSAPLRDVLSLLAEKHGLNLVMAQDAFVPITITLNEVTLMDALEAVVSVAGYTWTTHRGIVHVSSIASNNQLTPHVHGRVTRVFELDYVSAVDLDVAIKGMLSPSGRSEVMLSDSQDNRRTKEAIVVEDFPAFIHRVEQYVAQIDVLPRQVLIQVHVLQVDLDHNERHGINLEQLLRLGSGSIRINTVGLASASSGQAIFAEINGTDVDGLLEALETYTDSETLASPRVIALNGQESRLQVGEKLGFRTSTTTQTSTQENIQFLDVGVVLTVTPRITRDDNVLLHIRPEVSSGQISENTGLPSESTSEVETNLVLRSGQGIVIGGLIQERESFDESQAPFIGNVKVLGHLFKRRSQARERSEIIFVLVPHIISPNCGPDPWYGKGELVANSDKRHKIDFDQNISCGGNGQHEGGNIQMGGQFGSQYGGQGYQQYNGYPQQPPYHANPQTIAVPTNSFSANHQAPPHSVANQPKSKPANSFSRVGNNLFSRIDLNPFDRANKSLKKKNAARSQAQLANHPSQHQRTQSNAAAHRAVMQTAYQHEQREQQQAANHLPRRPAQNRGYAHFQDNSYSRTSGGVSFSFNDKSNKR